MDDTYARILCNIDEEHSKDAFKILQWLAYSARPLRIEEVAEVVAVDIEGDSRFDPENRLREPRDVLTICSSLVTTAASNIRSDDGDPFEGEELRLAHFSVKEYLVSDRVQTGPASRYSIKKHAHDYIAQTCLAYLLHFRGPTLLTSNNIDEFPLGRYAARYWTQHAREAGNETNSILVQQLSMDLFLSKRDAYANCVRLFNPNSYGSDMTMTFESITPPLYYASLTGLLGQVQELLEKGADVNAQGGEYGNALQAASCQGHDQVVERLLEKGADVNAQGGEFGNALQAASWGGHDQVVERLLEKGADVNAQGGEFGNALQAASEQGHDQVVERLKSALRSQ